MAADAEEFSEALIENTSYTKLVVPHNSVLSIEPYNSTHVAITPVNQLLQEDRRPVRSYFSIGQPGPIPVSGPFLAPYLDQHPNVVPHHP